MLLVVLADTHLRDGSARDLPPPVWSAIETADIVLHAGDLVGGEFLGRLRERSTLFAVLGNNDHTLHGLLPERRVESFEGVRIAMVHDAGPRAGRGARMARWFPSADLVVFGHSHEPCDHVEAGVHLFNPGSPTDRRRQPRCTFGLVEVAGGRVVRTEVVGADV